jgi:hypothetical protein
MSLKFPQFVLNINRILTMNMTTENAVLQGAIRQIRLLLKGYKFNFLVTVITLQRRMAQAYREHNGLLLE